MQIEKVSKFINSRSFENATGRRVLLSLPRVRWLEAQPDYTPWPPLETPKPPPPAVPDYKPGKYTLRPQYRNDRLSDAQKRAWDLHRSGMSHMWIGVEMNKTTNAVGKLIAQAREKLGIGL